MKALAYRIGGETYCCVCAEQLANISGFPNLFFATNKPKRVDEDRICPRCGHWYGSHDAGCAAERIAALITQNPVEWEIPEPTTTEEEA